MTHKQQRVALAEWDGWEELRDGWYKKDGIVERFIPDYLNDLNAVHELEMKMRGTLEQYHNDPMMHRRWKEYQYYLIQFYGASATAEERCEALLKTLNLWKP